MTTPYFVLYKPKSESIDKNAENKFVYIPGQNAYILPHNNFEYYTQFGLFESNLIEWCKQFCKKDRVFLDIGAHTGTYSISLADLCREVYSFEPQKSTYYALCGGVALSNIQNITCMNMGLGSKDQVGKKTLHIVSHDGGGSTVHRPRDGVLREETIEIQTLDSLSIQNVGFIKMDVEENELYVLQGARETLARSDWPPIVFESNTEENPGLFNYIKNDLGYKVIPISGCVNMFLAAKQ
jgi:FkbM family methyltransferase